LDKIIELENVNKTIRGRNILTNLNLLVRKGDIYGYLGPNGAGKTTTIRIIMGLFQPDSGIIRVFGESVNQEKYRRRIGFILEADGLYDNLNARENLEFYCGLYKIKKELASNRLIEILRMVGLQNRVKDRVSTYSKGMRQKLALARSMIHDPDILILDEPTAGIDPNGQVDVRNIILELARNKGKTIFLSSHNLDEVQRICNRIAIIDQGIIKIQDDLDNLKKRDGQQEIVIHIFVNQSQENRELDEVIAIIKRLPDVENVWLDERQIHISINKDLDVATLFTILSKHNLKIEQIQKLSKSLEEIYSNTVRNL
jgi:ABC-2 type transport system ATP-binding protein